MEDPCCWNEREYGIDTEVGEGSKEYRRRQLALARQERQRAVLDATASGKAENSDENGVVIGAIGDAGTVLDSICGTTGSWEADSGERSRCRIWEW